MAVYMAPAKKNDEWLQVIVAMAQQFADQKHKEKMAKAANEPSELERLQAERIRRELANQARTQRSNEKAAYGMLGTTTQEYTNAAVQDQVLKSLLAGPPEGDPTQPPGAGLMPITKGQELTPEKMAMRELAIQGKWEPALDYMKDERTRKTEDERNRDTLDRLASEYDAKRNTDRGRRLWGEDALSGDDYRKAKDMKAAISELEKSLGQYTQVGTNQMSAEDAARISSEAKAEERNIELGIRRQRAINAAKTYSSKIEERVLQSMQGSKPDDPAIRLKVKDATDRLVEYIDLTGTIPDTEEINNMIASDEFLNPKRTKFELDEINRATKFSREQWEDRFLTTWQNMTQGNEGSGFQVLQQIDPETGKLTQEAQNTLRMFEETFPNLLGTYVGHGFMKSPSNPRGYSLSEFFESVNMPSDFTEHALKIAQQKFPELYGEKPALEGITAKTPPPSTPGTPGTPGTSGASGAQPSGTPGSLWDTIVAGGKADITRNWNPDPNNQHETVAYDMSLPIVAEVLHGDNAFELPQLFELAFAPDGEYYETAFHKNVARAMTGEGIRVRMPNPQQMLLKGTKANPEYIEQTLRFTENERRMALTWDEEMEPGNPASIPSNWRNWSEDNPNKSIARRTEYGLKAIEERTIEDTRKALRDKRIAEEDAARKARRLAGAERMPGMSSEQMDEAAASAAGGGLLPKFIRDKLNPSEGTTKWGVKIKRDKNGVWHGEDGSIYGIGEDGEFTRRGTVAEAVKGTGFGQPINFFNPSGQESIRTGSGGGKPMSRSNRNFKDAVRHVDPKSNPLVMAIARHEGYFNGDESTAAQRNNNPGNIRVPGWDPSKPKGGLSDKEANKRAKRYGAEGYTPNGFLVFRTPEVGFQKIRNQLADYVNKKPDITVGEAVQTWAPSTENDVDAYLRSMGLQGVDPRQRLRDVLLLQA